MDALTLFAQSLLIGFTVAAPVGPIGLLTIQRSLTMGARAGLATGLGAAAADAVYGAIGAFGVSWLIQTLTSLRLPLAICGGAYLLWMACGLLRPVPLDGARVGCLAPANDWHFFSRTFLNRQAKQRLAQQRWQFDFGCNRADPAQPRLAGLAAGTGLVTSQQIAYVAGGPAHVDVGRSFGRFDGHLDRHRQKQEARFACLFRVTVDPTREMTRLVFRPGMNSGRRS